jgi:hypothetical protein
MAEMTAALDAVGELIAERAKFEGWLTALEQKAGSMPAHVVEKVRADYGGRLSGVLQQLAGQVGTLEGIVRALQSRDSELATRESAVRDEIAELELRHLVGELDDASMSSARGPHDDTLGGVTGERASIADDLGKVQGILGVAHDARQRSGETVARVLTPAQAPERITPPSLPVDAYDPVPPPPPAPSLGEDDLSFLKRPAAAPIAASGAAATVVEPSVRPISSAPSAPSRPTPIDPAKTLRCAECGTLNYPTEWYCERCGGELAAM